MTSVEPDKSSTQDFYALTPERILDSVEQTGIRCTGRCLALNSMENRVYEVEIEVEDESLIHSPSDRFRIAKFYRPGRWSKEQILEEHQFLHDLQESDIPVVAPLRFENSETLHQVKESSIWFTLFRKQGGRNPDELSDEQLDIVGRLIARMHNTGASRKAVHRVSLNPTSYGRNNLQKLIELDAIPPELLQAFSDTVLRLCDTVEPWFEGVPTHRIHGDAHCGNLLWGSEGPFWVDFDDMLIGPAVQDIWLLVPGRDSYHLQARERMISAYDVMRPFPRESLRLIEPLRALRIIHFTAWVASRISDPSFQRVFVDYGTPQYWREQMAAVQEVFSLIQTGERW